MTERIDEAYERWYGREKVYRAEEQVVGDGTMKKLEDQEVYMRLPPEAGKYANNFCVVCG
jgi:hypothetical protein